VQDQITARLEELKQEYARGQTRLQELEIQQAALRETLLRISGAIQVIEEELAKAEGRNRSASGAAADRPPISSLPSCITHSTMRSAAAASGADSRSRQASTSAKCSSMCCSMRVIRFIRGTSWSPARACAGKPAVPLRPFSARG